MHSAKCGDSANLQRVIHMYKEALQGGIGTDTLDVLQDRIDWVNVDWKVEKIIEDEVFGGDAQPVSNYRSRRSQRPKGLANCKLPLGAAKKKKKKCCQVKVMNQLSLPENGANSSNRVSSQKDDAKYDNVTNESTSVHSERVGNNENIAFARSASANESTNTNQDMNAVGNFDDKEVYTTIPKTKSEKSKCTNETDCEPKASESNHEFNVCR